VKGHDGCTCPSFAKKEGIQNYSTYKSIGDIHEETNEEIVWVKYSDKLPERSLYIHQPSFFLLATVIHQKVPLWKGPPWDHALRSLGIDCWWRAHLIREHILHGSSIWRWGSWQLILLMEGTLHQLIWRISHFSEGFINNRWCRISSTNSRTTWWPFDTTKLNKLYFYKGVLWCSFCNHKRYVWCS